MRHLNNSGSTAMISLMFRIQGSMLDAQSTRNYFSTSLLNHLTNNEAPLPKDEYAFLCLLLS